MSHGAELAALRRRLRQLDEGQAGWLPGEVLEPVADLPGLEGAARAVTRAGPVTCWAGGWSSSSTAGWGRAWACRGRSRC